jgi:HTH-type transcriptional regulator/antitoxin HigA
MLIRPLRNETDYEVALEEIERHFYCEPARVTPEGDRFDVLTTLIGAYEREHWPINPPKPIEAMG